MIDRVIPPNELIEKNPKIALELKKPYVKFEDIEDIKKDLRDERTARMIGLVSHLVYWSVFGDRLNALPLDTYHKKLLFIQISQIMSEIESRYSGKRIFTVLHMPVLLLAVRMIIEVIFKNTYSEFFAKE